MAERERGVERANKQLKRVQLQLADFIFPVRVANLHFGHAHDRAVLECGLLASYIASAVEWHEPPSQPEAAVPRYAAAGIYAALAATPFRMLREDDIAALAADVDKLAHWIDLAMHTLLPPLRQLAAMLPSVMHLAELRSADELDAILPGVGVAMGRKLIIAHPCILCIHNH